jgi:hypothetical protein
MARFRMQASWWKRRHLIELIVAVIIEHDADELVMCLQRLKEHSRLSVDGKLVDSCQLSIVRVNDSWGRHGAVEAEEGLLDS